MILQARPLGAGNARLVYFSGECFVGFRAACVGLFWLGSAWCGLFGSFFIFNLFSFLIILIFQYFSFSLKNAIVQNYHT